MDDSVLLGTNLEDLDDATVALVLATCSDVAVARVLAPNYYASNAQALAYVRHYAALEVNRG